MSRPTTVQHPLATLRKALDLGRTQLAVRLGISRPALEKIERRRNPFGPALRHKAFVAIGVCPGWLAREQGPIHTADGHPMTPAELARWEAWRNINARPDDPQDPPAALGGRPLGPLYRKGCCVDPVNLLAHGPLETPPGQGTAARRFQQTMEPEQHRRLCTHLIDRARGIAHRALSTWDRSENPLWELLAAMDKHFPDVPPMADPADEAAAAAAAFLESATRQASPPPAPRPTLRSGPTPRKSSKRHPIPAGSGARRPRPYQHEST